MKVTKDNFLFYCKIIKWPIILIIFFCVQWLFMTQYIKQIKYEYLSNIKENNKVEPFYFEYTKSKAKQIVLKPEEFKKMYEHINSLSEKVSDESKRTQEFIDKDIDRLNLYMAIGIGFLAVLGVIVPILINVLSYDDLRVKQASLDKEQKEIKKFFDENKESIQKSIQDSNNAITLSNDALTAAKRIDGTVEKVANLENSTAKVSTLILQQAITRYFSIVPYLVIDFDNDRFINIINGIKMGFEECYNNNNHSIINDKPLQTLISDFAYEINSTRSLSISVNREVSDIYIQLSQALYAHIKVATLEQETESNEKIVSLLNNLTKAVTKFYVKNKSAVQAS